MTEILRKTVVIVGDPRCGKSALFFRLYKVHDRAGNTPTKGFNRKVIFNMTVAGVPIKLAVLDTNDSNYDDPGNYLNVDVIAICYSVDSPNSLANVAGKWHPEIRRLSPSVPVVLVGTKTDLRTCKNTIRSLRSAKMEPVKTEFGESMAGIIGASAYLECSVKSNEGVVEAFDTIAEVAMLPPVQVAFLKPAAANHKVTRTKKTHIFKNIKDILKTFFFQQEKYHRP